MEDPLKIFEKEVLKVLNAALRSLDYQPVEDIQQAPEGKGDLAFPCFRSAAEHGRKPGEMAKQLEYVVEESPLVEKVVAMGPYLNFFLDSERVVEEVLRACLESKGDFGRLEGTGSKIILEHTSANPTGPFHVGRARNPILGDSLARVLRMAGHEVETQYWVNDMGKQAVILTYGLERCPGGEADRDKSDHVATINYRQANALMEEDGEVAAEIEEMVRRVENLDIQILPRVKEATEKVLKGMRRSLSRLNVKVDEYVRESRSVEDGTATRVVEGLKGSDRCAEEDGAHYLDLEGLVHGRNPRFFFTRRDGTTLYTTRDVAYHTWKLSNCDLAINILGEDHKLEALQLETALKVLGYEKVPEVVFYAFVSLPSLCSGCGASLEPGMETCPACGRDVSEEAGKRMKMSTRKGLAVYLDDLMDEAEERAFEVVTEKRGDLTGEERREIAEKVGIGAIRYNIIRVQAEKSMVFRWDEALNLEGKTAPFIQYAHARACSIMREAGDYDLWRAKDLTEKGEVEMVKVLGRFPGVIRRSASSRQLHTLADYAHEVATSFNRFYRDYRVIGSRIEDTRLAVVDATRWVLRNALEALGIEAPDHM